MIPIMKLNHEPAGSSNRKSSRGRRIDPTPEVRPIDSPMTADGPGSFRRLEGKEMVSRGDFVVDEFRGFEPWDGPGGFRADAFVKPIYRRIQIRSVVRTK
jgi:hypothetical protein